MGTNIDCKRKDKYDSVFNSERKIQAVFYPYNIFRKARRKKHYHFYNIYIDEKEMKRDWKLLNDYGKKPYLKEHEYCKNLVHRSTTV